ncbi:putative sulfate exporter family transporter [Aliiglaciecola sp. 2_MG-2023]|uniref:YeiH family protein n=1 Tax=Alteromonadaceae TaxID=72275 RepID=UPI0026E3BE24|nr:MULTISPECIES: putative sulfate exporter family transporter [unclassified Aliiglaciecola]MDO6711990.1 putative sulfate exporter family transporter [Aliiglaciecola sp. 2_MG-2023]MDO6753646.1 putative sulfate exporter family transporter [Aliiglaciecola sp. 1_MG-2023]
MYKLKALIPGVMLATIVGLAALFLSEHYGAPSMLFALLLGIALSFLYEESQCKAGIEFTATHILRFGVAMLGFRIAFGDLVALGWKTALLLIVAIVTTILIGTVLARLLGMQKRFGVLTGGAVGICGASAAMAIAAVLPDSKHKDRDTLLTIIGVTALSTLSMILYPIIASQFNLDQIQTGIFLGATIHDVAQVVGAGYSVSEQSGDLATLTKLVRVAFLMPVVIAILLVLKLRLKRVGTNKAPGIPGFLIIFVVLMIINSVFSIPSAVTESASHISRFALVVSIAAIGMKSNLKQLVEVGTKPILLLIMETIWIASLILICLPIL